MNFILAQILGICALISVCIGYFLKDKSKFLISQVIGNFFYSSAFLVVEAYVGGVLVLISLIRCIYLYYAEKYNFKYTKHFLSIFIVLFITLGIVFWNSPYDFIPMITGTIFTLGYSLKNLQLMRHILILPNVMLVIYNILCRTYTNAILDTIEVIVIITAIIKFNKTKRMA